MEEMASLLQIKKQVIPGTWHGKYTADLAHVMDMTENGDVSLRLVPGINLMPQ